MILLHTYKNLWQQLCSFDNLLAAYQQAVKNKSCNPHVIEFEQHWLFHLCTLLRELKNQTYTPKPLRTFVLRDPKTRVICVSHFRDRIIHHALINVLKPLFEPRFIYDSYASRKGKGTHVALKRFDVFVRKVTKNGKPSKNAYYFNQFSGFALKADIQHYFQTVDHQVLLELIQKTVKDSQVIWLVKKILNNYHSIAPEKGMPLGNWTSQFFANIYLNELDQYVKHTLKAKYYIRYVDDFVILHHSYRKLQQYELLIKEFLGTLKLQLHPHKCKIIPLSRGVSFLGFRVFYTHKLVRSRNLRKIKKRIAQKIEEYKSGSCSAQDVFELLHSWNSYAMHGNTYHLREKLKQGTEQELQTISISP